MSLCKLKALREVTSNSPRRQQAQNATHATAYTVASKEFVRSKCLRSASRCSRVIGQRLGCRESDGASFVAPFFTCDSKCELNHRASATWCPLWIPANHLSTVELDTFPAAQLATNNANSNSEAGIQPSSGNEIESQYWLNLKRPAPQPSRVFGMTASPSTCCSLLR